MSIRGRPHSASQCINTRASLSVRYDKLLPTLTLTNDPKLGVLMDNLTDETDLGDEQMRLSTFTDATRGRVPNQAVVSTESWLLWETPTRT